MTRVFFWQVGTNCLRVRGVICSYLVQLRTSGFFQLFELEADVKLIMTFSNPECWRQIHSQIIALIIRNVNLNQSNSLYVCVCVCVCN